MDRIDAMKVFVTALDEGSLAGASRRLKRSPTAVSRAIAFLEDHVGVELLHRTKASHSRTKLYRLFYAVMTPLAGLLARQGMATTTTLLGQALLEAIERPPRDYILNNKGINELGQQRLDRRAR